MFQLSSLISSLSICLLVLTLSVSECTAQPGPVADLVLTGGAIYTVNADQPWAEAMAVTEGTIVFVGSNSDVQGFIGAGTQVIDLAGRMAMPGIHDSHMHILEANHVASGTCYLPPGQPLESHISRIQACAPDQVGTDWVLGYGHSILDLLEHIDFGGTPPIEILDLAVPDRPAAFLEETSHSVWANSLALEAAGFDAASTDPVGGAILRDPITGEPNGVLLDAAGELVMDLALAPNAELEALNYQALLDGLELAGSHGITSVVDARGHWRRGYVEAWQRARDEGTLTARAIVSLWAYPYLNDAEQIAQLSSLFDNDPESMLRLSQIKIYSDGEITHTTAGLLDPYTCCDLAGPLGLNYFDQGRLTQYITQLEAVGFDFHIHAIGDRAVHEALNAIETVQQTQCPPEEIVTETGVTETGVTEVGIAEAGSTNLGCSKARHRLTHLELIAPDDIPRLPSLGVIADMQMSHKYVEPPYLHLNDKVLGADRIDERLWQLRTLHDAGANVVLSSDFDVGDPSPFKGMQRALTRGPQSLPSLDEAIRAYTINAAYLMRQEDTVGSLEVGKLADVIVLDRNLFDLPLASLGTAQVIRTFIGGQQVWGEGTSHIALFTDGFETGSTSQWDGTTP